jgi:VWFA-related protein
MKQLLALALVAGLACTLGAAPRARSQSQQPTQQPATQPAPQPAQQQDQQSGGQQPPAPETPPQQSTPAPQQTAPPAQQSNVPPPQASNVPSARVLRSRTELVPVPVTVKNTHGELVPDLTKDDFRVFEDGKEQNIALFSTEAFPLSVVVVLDNDLTVKVRDQVQKSLDSIAGGLSQTDEAAVILYDQFPEPAIDFTADNDTMLTKLHRLRLGESFPGDFGGPMDAGATVNNQQIGPGVKVYGKGAEKVTKDLDDAMHAAAELLRARGRDRRKVICLISDGQNSHHNRYSYGEVLQLLLTSDISVYSVTVGTLLLKHEPGRMTKYANDTGGDSFFASKQADLERLYSSIGEQARNQYTLAYAPQNPGVGDYHTIEVRVERPGLQVSSRQGYYASAKR